MQFPSAAYELVNKAQTVLLQKADTLPDWAVAIFADRLNASRPGGFDHAVLFIDGFEALLHLRGTLDPALTELGAQMAEMVNRWRWFEEGKNGRALTVQTAFMRDLGDPHPADMGENPEPRPEKGPPPPEPEPEPAPQPEPEAPADEGETPAA